MLPPSELKHFHLCPINIVLPKVWKRKLVEQIVWVFSIIIFRQISKTQFCSEQGVAKTETWQQYKQQIQARGSWGAKISWNT